jgi:multicomponent Na+:H+ antiporter subunit E
MSQMLQVSIPLFIVYLALSGNAEPVNLVVGALVAVGISLLRPKVGLPLIKLKRLPQFVWAAIRYLLVIVVNMVQGGISTARIVLDPSLPINPGIIAIPSGTQSELGTALSAHAIGLSPGEMVVAIDHEGVMYTHCLNVENSESMVAEAQELRKNLLSRMFE